ncbi:putative integral component of membrane [Aeromonas phage vB_AhydM-H1]|nr:putative integral component of membrane [Aeromonas phage vB_AhydM-H1]
MQALVLQILKVVGSKLLMGLLQEGIKQLEKREDNTVSKKDVERVREIAKNNLVKDKPVKVTV